MDPQLLGNLRHALAMGWAHPPSHISFDGLAVTTLRSIPSGPLVVEMVGMERRHLSWQRGLRMEFARSLNRNHSSTQELTLLLARGEHSIY